MIGADWTGVLAELTARLDTATTGPPNGDPTARLPGAELRRWVHIRDGQCAFPGCRAPAHRTDTDHTIEHTKGGATVDTGLAAACRHDHRLRHEGGWQVAQDQPGQITWTSRHGRTYQRHRAQAYSTCPTRDPTPSTYVTRSPHPKTPYRGGTPTHASKSPNPRRHHRRPS